jgi:hypothetical protein
MLRSALIAISLARRLGLSEERQAVAYYATLLAWIGCHADSHELSAWFGDDIAFRADTYDVDWAGLPFVWLLASHVGRDRPAVARAGRAAALLGRLRGNLRELMSSHCLSAGALAERAGLGGLTKEAVRLATEGVAHAVACEGCPPLTELTDRYLAAGGRYLTCPICFNARKLDENATLGGTVPMWQWIGDEPAVTFSY